MTRCFGRSGLTAFLAAAVLVVGSSAVASEPPREFNDERAFPSGQVGDSYALEDVRFDYQLLARSDDVQSEEVFSLRDCRQSLETPASKVARRHFHRLRLIQLTCVAVQEFAGSEQAERSYMPEELSEEVVRRLPALTEPLLSDDETVREEKESKTLGDVYPEMQVDVQDPLVVQVEAEHVRLAFEVLARADFDGDGYQDWLILSRGRPKDAFGRWQSLVLLSRVGWENPITVTWRDDECKPCAR